jgi:hypothetical protein
MFTVYKGNITYILFLFIHFQFLKYSGNLKWKIFQDCLFNVQEVEAALLKKENLDKYTEEFLGKNMEMLCGHDTTKGFFYNNYCYSVNIFDNVVYLHLFIVSK